MLSYDRHIVRLGPFTQITGSIALAQNPMDIYNCALCERIQAKRVSSLLPF